MRKVELYDTTLRDGTQAENFQLSVEDKVRVSKHLDNLKIDFIEGGWPGSNPLSIDYFKAMEDVKLNHSILTAFGSTRRFDNPAEKDKNLNALIAAKTQGVTIFGKSWDIHVTEALQIELADNLQIIEDSLAYLRPHVQHLLYDAEHFFDGFKNNQEYCLATIGKAVSGGAQTIVLCDTNGGTLPHEIGPIIEKVKSYLAEINADVKIGIHTHNDSECAVANALLAVELGADQVQGTINGYGERCGNCNLTSVLPALSFKMNYECSAVDSIEHLYKTSRLVDELANLPHNRYQPYVGESAFAHKGGIHVSAVKRNPITYEHVEPEKVGNIRRVIISDQSGRSNLVYKAREFGIELDSNDPVMAKLIKDLKSLENQGYQYDVAEASFELLMHRAKSGDFNFFKPEGFRVINFKYQMDKHPLTEATIRLFVDGKEVHTASMGDGPVNALDKALRKALVRFYSGLNDMELTDYKVRVLSGQSGTDAKVRVLVESRDKNRSWSTVGVSENIIEASWQALVDSINYKLMKDGEKQGSR